MEHAWCRDAARDAAVRAAEDNRTQPLPTLAEAIARPFSDAAERSSTVSETGEGQSRMRRERVTLEVKHFSTLHADQLGWGVFAQPVRVVDTHAEAVAESVAWEGARDAYRGRILRLTEEREELKARVAELEARTSTAGEALCAAPAASGGTLAQIAAAFHCQPDDDNDLVEAARLLVRERDEALAKAASGGGQQNVSDGTLSAPAGDRSQNCRLEAASGGGDVPRD
jgi:hypothetical protein